MAQSKSEQLPGVKFGIKNDNLFEWAAEIDGPRGTPYEGGKFKFDITLGGNYPHKPPKIVCKTRIYHCNINTLGTICLDVLKQKWTAIMTIRTALLAVQQLYWRHSYPTRRPRYLTCRSAPMIGGMRHPCALALVGAVTTSSSGGRTVR